MTELPLLPTTVESLVGGIPFERSRMPFFGHLKVLIPFTWLDRLFVRLAHRVIGVSLAARNALCGNRISLVQKFRIIPNAVPFPGPPASLRKELGIARETVLVGAAGRLDPGKGL